MIYICGSTRFVSGGPLRSQASLIHLIFAYAKAIAQLGGGAVVVDALTKPVQESHMLGK